MEEILSGKAELLPVDSLFQACSAVTLTEGEARLCRNGNAFPRPGLPDGEYRVYGPDGEFLMLGRCSGGALSTIRSFFEVDHG